MGEITRTIDNKGQPSFKYRTTLELLADELLQERCLFFLGAGASIDPKKPDLPSAEELSKEMAKKCGIEWYKYVPLSTIAYYYEFFYSRKSLNTFLQKKIGNQDIEPSTCIERLIKCIKILDDKNKKILVVTTNYDRHFECAFKNTFQREPGVIIYKGGWDPNDKGAKLHEGLDKDPEFWLPQDQTYLYKMHGCISQPDDQNLVITEEDYINFLTNTLNQSEEKRLLHFVRGRIAMSTILFIGYSLSDWNFRVIFKASAEGKGTTSYAVQYYIPPDKEKESKLDRARWQALIEFWGKKNVDIINVDASQFMQDVFKVIHNRS